MHMCIVACLAPVHKRYTGMQVCVLCIVAHLAPVHKIYVSVHTCVVACLALLHKVRICMHMLCIVAHLAAMHSLYIYIHMHAYVCFIALAPCSICVCVCVCYALLHPLLLCAQHTHTHVFARCADQRGMHHLCPACFTLGKQRCSLMAPTIISSTEAAHGCPLQGRAVGAHLLQGSF